MRFNFRSLLFLPGNKPGMVQNGSIYGADAVILDLEDAVSPDQKDAARFLVTEALASLDFAPSATVVRINPLDLGGEKDLAMVVPKSPAAILLPKAQRADEIVATSRLIGRYEPKAGAVGLIALIETPLGVLQSLEIAGADPRLGALAFGAEDYTASLGVVRSKAGTEIAFARALVANAAEAAGIEPIDTPFTDFADSAALRLDTETAKSLGFKGKLCIHPSQVTSVHQVFDPQPDEIAWAGEVVTAFEAALAAGVGAVAVKGKMIDAPIVARARRILELARRVGLAAR